MTFYVFVPPCRKLLPDFLAGKFHQYLGESFFAGKFQASTVDIEVTSYTRYFREKTYLLKN